MTEALSLMYGIDLPARSIVGLPAEQERTLFLVGTLSLKQDNQVCLLGVDDDWLQITKRSFIHPAGEIWNMSSSPSIRTLLPHVMLLIFINLKTSIIPARPPLYAYSFREFLISTHIFGKNIFFGNDTVQTGVGLWKMSADESNLVELAQYTSPPKTGKCVSAEFHPSGNKMAIAVNNSVLIADVTNSLKIECSTLVDGKIPISTSVWNPHSNGSTLAVAYNTSVKGVDVRSLQEAFYIKHVNSPRVRNLDFNPNVQHILATCGDDFRVALWDVRKLDMPLKVLQDHSHWVWCVKFNPIHDQLLLSAGSDARLFLNSLESLSSESIHSLALEPDDNYSSPENVLGDERLEKMEEHEESVYSCAWAGNDPWIFASVSFDGRVIVSKVKRHHKYAILRL
ncbi:Protein TSSC1 [Dirofilaria immitis]|nr:Protein TSSC1 [Dirofilaria immitis]